MDGSVLLGLAGRKRLMEIYRRQSDPAVRRRAGVGRARRRLADSILSHPPEMTERGPTVEFNPIQMVTRGTGQRTPGLGRRIDRGANVVMDATAPERDVAHL